MNFRLLHRRADRPAQRPGGSYWGFLPLLLVIVALRAFSLEMFDLIDPSEARYAWVSQYMLRSGNWLMPHLMADGQAVPYFSKPPLHFWLAAVCSKLFGFDEWVVRLPSFFAFCLLLWLSFRLAGLMNLPVKVRRAAPFVTASLGLLFILAGTATVDVTFSACLSLALVALVQALQSQSTRSWLLATVGLCLAILTKGPAALVFFGVPALAAVYEFSRPTFPVLRRLTLLVATAIVLALPWFLLAEYYYPGYLRYFLLDENFSRFAASAAGDRYGPPHAHTHGTIIPVAVLVFLPWSPLVVLRFCALLKTRAWLPGERFAWSILLWPLLFLTISTTWLPAYLLPAVLGVGIIGSIAAFENLPFRLFRLHARSLGYGAVALVAGTLLCGFFLSPAAEKAQSLAVTVMSCLVSFSLISLSRRPLIERVALASTTLCFCAITMWSPYGSSRESTRHALSLLSEEADEQVVEVGILSQKSYSFFVYSSEFESELPKQVKIKWMDSANLVQSSSGVKNLLVDGSELREFASLLLQNYQVQDTFGKWTWLRAKVNLTTLR